MRVFLFMCTKKKPVFGPSWCQKMGFLAGYQASIPIKMATTYPITQHNDMAMENGPFDDLPVKKLWKITIFNR